MTDLLTILPDLPTNPFSNLLPSLEKNRITTTDLLTLDAVDVAKRAQLPAREVRRLTDAVLQALHQQFGFSNARTQGGHEDAPDHVESPLVATGHDLVARWQTISTLDSGLDEALGGGIPTGYLTEITGESGAGKTQLLLTLLLSIQLPPPHGLSKSALYISTEAPLQTTRLDQILSAHPLLAGLPSSEKPSLSRILSIQTPDLEAQEHILRYQLPVAIRRHNIGLVVLDSVTANFRAELDQPTPAAMAKRSAQLVETGALLRELARMERVAVLVANQVADRFDPAPSTGGMMNTRHEGGASSTPEARQDPLTLDHQQRWFTGWGDEGPDVDAKGLKTPSLGLVWTNQIAARIALVKRSAGSGGPASAPEASSSRRFMRVVFASWVRGCEGDSGVEFVIGNYGVSSVQDAEVVGASASGDACLNVL